jgi:predicted membrane GTPase involved in stress response
MKEHTYTIEQQIQLRHVFSQRKFAEEAARLVPTTERNNAEITDSGLLLAAIGELDLEGAVETLLQKYGKNLSIGKPAIRYISEPVLLEPYMNVEVMTPVRFLGSVAGELNGRKALITAMKDSGDMKVVRVEVPLSMMFGYSTTLRTLTEARGSFTMQFLEYRPVQSGPGGSGPSGGAAIHVA